MNHTKIEWVRNPDGSQGFTWNPLTGCLNHTNGLCKGGGFPCYAYRLAHGRLRERYCSNRNTIKRIGSQSWELYNPFYPRFWSEKLREPYNKTTRWGSSRRYTQKAKGIFVCDMSDLFGIGVPEEWTQRILVAIRDCPQHRFYLLTKQSQNLIKFSPFPDNCWVGVTFTDDRAMFDGYKHMMDIEAKVKYISFEPLLGGLTPLMLGVLSSQYKAMDWLIIGAQTRPTILPKIEWVEEIVRAADKAGIPVFLKDNLIPLLNRYRVWEWDWAINSNGKLRQELPK